jgi:hypothetical protein
MIKSRHISSTTLKPKECPELPYRMPKRTFAFRPIPVIEAERRDDGSWREQAMSAILCF